MRQWYRSEQLHLFQIQYSYLFYCVLYLRGGGNTAILRQKSNSTVGHWFVFTHVVILAQWIDLGSTTQNTNCSTAWQRSICHHTPVLSLLMHSLEWLCLEIHVSAEERAQKPHSVTNTISNPSLCCCLSAALVMLNVIHTEESNPERFTQKAKETRI